MDVELLSRAKIRDIERESAGIRMLAAAERAKAHRRSVTPGPKRRPAPFMPLRLLRRVCREAEALRTTS